MESSVDQRIRSRAADGAQAQSAVVDENEVRAAAGLTMVIGAVAFGYAYFDKQYVPLQIVAAGFRDLADVPSDLPARVAC